MVFNAIFNNISIISWRSSPIGWVVILNILHAEIIKTDVIVFIRNIIICLNSNWLIIFSIRVALNTITLSLHLSIRVRSLILTISLGEIKDKMSNKPINIDYSWFVSQERISQSSITSKAKANSEMWLIDFWCLTKNQSITSQNLPSPLMLYCSQRQWEVHFQQNIIVVFICT